MALFNKRIEDYRLSTPIDAYVSQNFQLWELTKSDIAVRHGIDNGFDNIDHLHNAIRVSRQILQPMRDEFGPFVPNSVYRSQTLERILKRKPLTWISKSQHTEGKAEDSEIATVSNIDLAQWIYSNLEFDQLILECYNPALGPNSGWVHCSVKGEDNRGQVLSYVMADNGKYRYVDGIVTDDRQ